MHRAREEGLLIIVYKAIGMKPSLKPGQEMTTPLPFLVPLTDLTPPYNGEQWEKKAVAFAFCLLH